MKAKIDTSSIVLAGHWNRSIFSPAWVNANVFHTEESELLLTFPAIATTYKHRQVVFEIHQDRLIFKPLQRTDNCLGRAEKMASDTLDVLTHTPLVGVGFNFSFAETSPSDALLGLFNSGDGAAIARTGWVPTERRLLRKLTNDGRTLNLSLLFNGREVTFDFNFHKEAATAAAARNAVQDQLVALRDQAIKFMIDVYGLQLENEDDDE